MISITWSIKSCIFHCLPIVFCFQVSIVLFLASIWTLHFSAILSSEMLELNFVCCWGFGVVFVSCWIFHSTIAFHPHIDLTEIGAACCLNYCHFLSSVSVRYLENAVRLQRSIACSGYYTSIQTGPTLWSYSIFWLDLSFPETFLSYERITRSCYIRNSSDLAANCLLMTDLGVECLVVGRQNLVRAAGCWASTDGHQVLLTWSYSYSLISSWSATWDQMFPANCWSCCWRWLNCSPGCSSDVAWWRRWGSASFEIGFGQFAQNCFILA